MIYGGEMTGEIDFCCGDKILTSVIDLEDENGQIILSLRKANHQQIWEKFKQKKETGEMICLQVSDANKGGLIFEIEDVKGFLPVSQLSYEHYPRVEGGDKDEIFSRLKKLVGQRLNLKVLDVDQKDNKLIFRGYQK